MSARDYDTDSDANSPTHQKYPSNIEFLIADDPGVDRYYFRTPTGAIAGIRGKSVEMARDILADSTPGFNSDDFEVVDSIHAEPTDYPDPVDSDRDVNEYDVWMLKHAMAVNGRNKRLTTRRNPTNRMLAAVLDEWGTPADIPLDNPDALQQATGIGPSSAGRITGAAIANRLIERPTRSQ